MYDCPLDRLRHGLNPAAGLFFLVGSAQSLLSAVILFHKKP